MMAQQTWDPQRYARNARFVSDLGAPVLELLAAKPGERILDLGCGDGVLTAKLVELGCSVVGIDASAEQIVAARELGLEVYVLDAYELSFQNEFDAVFSNAVLHWMKRPDDVIAAVWRALKPSGRFVAELGGFGCVDAVVSALTRALAKRGVDAATVNPWYFPTVEDYRERLVRRGFAVDYIALIPRPTPLPGDISAWLETFCESFTTALEPAGRAQLIDEVRELLRPTLCDADNNWSADYVRLRFAAHHS